MRPVASVVALELDLVATRLPGGLDAVPENGPANAGVAMRFVDNHVLQLSPGLAAVREVRDDNQRGGPDDRAACFGDNQVDVLGGEDGRQLFSDRIRSRRGVAGGQL